MLQGEYKDLAKFAEGTNSYLFGGKLEDSFKNAKGRHDSLQALKPTPPPSRSMLQLSESSIKPQKTTDQPKVPWLATRAPHIHSTTPLAHGWN